MLAGVCGTRAAVSATFSLLAWLSFALRSGLKTCFVQHWLIPASANPENPSARTQAQETSWDQCQNPSRLKGRKGDGGGQRCLWLLRGKAVVEVEMKRLGLTTWPLDHAVPSGKGHGTGWELCSPVPSPLPAGGRCRSGCAILCRSPAAFPPRSATWLC